MSGDQAMYPPMPQMEYDQKHGGAPPPQGGYPQQQGGYPAQQAPPPYPGQGQQGAAFSPPGPASQTIVVAQQMRFGETPVSMNCPRCQASIITATEYVNGNMGWIGCLICCGVGFLLGGITWLGCCLIPFCINACKDVEHHCPNCQQLVGKMNRLG